jgi:predicted nucleic acid-binding Zn ribbon protein
MECIICNQLLINKQQKFCSNLCKQKNEWRIKKGILHNQTRRTRDRKIYFVNLLGGKCSRCGYNKNYSALEFHHLDPSIKSFNLSGRKFSNTTLDKLTNEIQKCILLCANCHREIEHPNAIF